MRKLLNHKRIKTRTRSASRDYLRTPGEYGALFAPLDTKSVQVLERFIDDAPRGSSEEAFHRLADDFRMGHDGQCQRMVDGALLEGHRHLVRLAVHSQDQTDD